MKALQVSRAMAVSSLLVFGIAAIAYLILFSLSADAAQVVAIAILGTLVPVYKYLREKQIRQVFLEPAANHNSSISSYTLKWYLILLYGSFFLFGGYQLASGLLGFQGGAVVGILTSQPQALSVRLSDHDYKTIFDLFQFANGLVVVFLVRPIITYLVGRWVGKKGNRYGIASMFVIPLSASVLNLLLIIVSPERLVTFQSTQTKGAIVAGTIGMEVVSLIISVPLGLLGYWRGRKKLLNGYLNDLFKQVPKDKKATVVESLYQQVVKTMGAPITKADPEATEMPPAVASSEQS